MSATREVMDWDNIVEMDVDLHRAWHTIFDTLTPDEAIKLIRYAMQPNLRWTYREWQRLIGHIKERP